MKAPAKKSTETLLIAILEAHEPDAALRPHHWTPWFESDPTHRELTVNMAAHKMLRARGGLSPDEKSWTIKVYSAPASTPRLANGNPKEATVTTLSFVHS